MGKTAYTLLCGKAERCVCAHECSWNLLVSDCKLRNALAYDRRWEGRAFT